MNDDFLKINYDEVISFIKSKEVIYASECGEKNRKITCLLNGNFKVYSNDDCIYCGDDLIQAVDLFNSL